MRSLPHSLAPRVLGAMGLLVLVLSAFGEPTLALLGALALLLGWAGWRVLGQGQVATHSVGAQAMFVWLLMAYALVVVIGVELVFLRDVFGSRMNTVFKFHYHVWIMLGLASAAALGTLWRGPNERLSPPGEPDAAPPSRAWRPVAGTVVACMLAGGLVYPLAATWTKSGEFRGQPTLDGERFLEQGSPADHHAIEWLRSSATGRPVVVEAIGGSYQEFARVSTFSGLPTVAGWIGHELQWRGERPEYRQREQDVDAIYRGTEREAIFDLGRRYNAHYVFFGSLERTKYGAESQSRLDTLLPVAYSRGGTTIYSLTGREDGAP